MRQSWPVSRQLEARPPLGPQGHPRAGRACPAMGQALPCAARHPAPDRGGVSVYDAVSMWHAQRRTPTPWGWHADRTSGTSGTPTTGDGRSTARRLSLDADRSAPRPQRYACAGARGPCGPAGAGALAIPPGLYEGRATPALGQSPEAARQPGRRGRLCLASCALPACLAASTRPQPAAGGGERGPPHGAARAP